jgi:hypothetical protein
LTAWNLFCGVGVIVGTDGQLGTISSSARFKEAIKPMDQASEAILAEQHLPAGKTPFTRDESQACKMMGYSRVVCGAFRAAARAASAAKTVMKSACDTDLKTASNDCEEG